MKNTLIPHVLVCALGLCAFDVAAREKQAPPATELQREIACPVASPAKTKAPRMEVCFVLDTTGSMGGLIEGAKQKIWSIANELVAAKPTPELRVGLIGYRDRGDSYVTKVFNLTNDLDAVYGHLKTFEAGGGGDTPESVSQALDEAVRLMSWSQDREVLKVVFLVGDAPPHTDYADGPDYRKVCESAVKGDLIVNTIQCGELAETTPIWQEIAKFSEGSFAAIPQSGNVAVIAAPQDAELAKLNRELNSTVIAYGEVRERETLARKLSASEAAPAASQADRLYYNFQVGRTVQGGGELLDSLAAGEVKLESLQRDKLPKDLQSLSDGELKAKVETQQQERQKLQQQIETLSKDRANFITAENERLAATGKGDSLDEQVATIIRQQAARKGITYTK